MKRPSIGGTLRGLVAIALTAYLLWRSHPTAVWRAATGARAGPIVLAVLLVLADRTLMAYRWIVLLRPLSPDVRPRFAVLMRIFFVSTFVGTFLPASVGGDAVRAYALARERVPGSAAVASVFMDRMLGVLSVLILAIVGLFLVRDLVTDPLVVLSLVVTTTACLVSAMLVFSSRAAHAARRIIGRIPWAPLQRVSERLIDAVQCYATHRGDLLNVLAGSIGVQVLRVVQGYLLGVGLGIGAGLVAYFAFIPVILLVMLLPVTVNGLGTGQAAFVWFFARAGVASAPAFALSVLFVALGIVGNLPGGILYATGTAATGRDPAVNRGQAT